MVFMTVDQKAQVANAREEQQMSNENDERNSAEVACPSCEGCGQLADSDDREPWSVWMALPVGSALAVTMGLVKPEPCDECGRSGKVAAQPAVLHTPTEWCWTEGVEILDPDGWRGVNGRPWNDPITLAEFRERLVVCMQRSVAPAGEQHIPDVELGFDPHPVELCEPERCRPTEHHVGTLDLSGEGNGAAPISDDLVQRITEATADPDYPWLSALDWTRATLEAAYPAIRQQVAEEIAVAIERSEDHARQNETTEGIAGNKTYAATWGDLATGYMRSAELAREIGGKA